MSKTPIRGPRIRPIRSQPSPEPRTGEAASFGGEGWQERPFSHGDELQLGHVWRACGYAHEAAPLREVLISWPGEELDFEGDPNLQLMLEPIDLARIREQAAGIVDFFRSQDVLVHVDTPRRPPPPNYLFMRDLFYMTPEGAILGRVAAQQRVGEERFAAEALTRIGVPILHTPRGRVTFEGADVLQVRPDVVWIGVGRRTNDLGFRFLSEALQPFGIRTVPIPMPAGTQHLLGLANFVDRDRVVVHATLAPRELKDAMSELGIHPFYLEPDDEMIRGRAMNFVTLGPGRLVMPAGCPATRRRFEKAGFEVHELEIGEYLKGAGGLGCLTGIIRRG